ncbi:MAG: sensor domain-containing diguanylate cyclase [Phycisphaeraceae bacterium]|nr:sensor domain-containing diguanylate cyclase [Phycisphaeraceae bacterium]
MIDQAVVGSEEADLVLTSDVLRRLTDGVYIVDRDRKILFWNQAAQAVTGYDADEVVGSRCNDNLLRHVDEQGRCLCEDGCPLQAIMEDGIPREAHVYLSHHDGHRVPVHVRGTPIFGSDNEVIGCVEVFNDDTPRLSMMERLAKLENQALLDPLTGLGNRRLFDDTLKKTLKAYERQPSKPFGLILVDIDHFKKVNDFYGHQVGDMLLGMVGRTLSGHCRAYDTATRWGGEEFALILEDMQEKQIVAMANRIKHAIGRSCLEYQQCHVSVSVSLGVTLSNTEDTVNTLFARADALLLDAKEAGRNTVKFG